jgi:predicted HTH transcriptional regulator
MARIVRDGFERLWSDQPSGQPRATELADLIAAGESQTVELKSSARWNYKGGLHDRKMEHIIVKSVCGFLNAEGGSIVIGVSDDGIVHGLAADFATFKDGGTRDKYELFLRQLVDSNLSISTAGLVKIRFERSADADVCVVSVASSGKPVFAKPLEGAAGPSEFWVRAGNATKQLHGDDMIEYRDQHWG